MLIDTHAHLQDYADLKTILNRAADNGVEKIICIGYDLESSLTAVNLARQHKEVYAAVGIHPQIGRASCRERV